MWSLDILHPIDCGPEINRGYWYVLVVIDNFSRFIWKIPLKNENAQRFNDFFENILAASKRKPNLIETDNGKEFEQKLY